MSRFILNSHDSDTCVPLPLRETTAWMQEVGQRQERLPRAREWVLEDKPVL